MAVSRAAALHAVHVEDADTAGLSRRSLIAGASAAGVLGGIAGLIPGSGIDIARAAGAEDSMVSVKDFGAKGDGATDDSATIQKAIDETAADGRTVFIPGGVYMIGTTLSLRNNLTLRGASRAATTLRLAPTSSGPILEAAQSGGIYQTVDDFVLMDLSLDGDAEHTSVPGTEGAPPLLRAYQSRRWHVARCRVVGSRGYGVGLLGDPRSTTAGKQGPHEDIYLLDCEFNNNGTVATGNGITTMSAKRITLEHCTAIGNLNTGLYIKAQFAGLVGCHVADNNIGLILDSATNSAESTDDDAYVTVLGGSAEGNAQVGLSIVRESDQSIDKGRTHATVVGFNSRKNGLY